MGQRNEKIRECLYALTPSIHEDFFSVVSGFMNKEIAERLNTSEKTIRVHRASIMVKKDARTLVNLVRIAEKTGVQPLRSK